MWSRNLKNEKAKSRVGRQRHSKENKKKIYGNGSLTATPRWDKRLNVFGVNVKKIDELYLTLWSSLNFYGLRNPTYWTF